MHYYQFNIADYIKDAWHLSLVEHGIYRQLIDWYYLDEKQIPKETQVVIRRLRLGLDDVRYLENVLSDFFILTDLGYYHKRIHAELERYQTQFAKNRVNGKSGGRPKKQQLTDDKTQVVILENPNVTQTEPKITLTNNQEPITKNKLKSNTLGDKSPKVKIQHEAKRFDEFWALYPSRPNRPKSGKKPCLAKWRARKLDLIADVIMANVMWHKKNNQEWKEGFAPNPEVYINQSRWEDGVTIESENRLPSKPLVKTPEQIAQEKAEAQTAFAEYQKSLGFGVTA